MKQKIFLISFFCVSICSKSDIAVSNKDFCLGTYKIKNPGYYYLTEDIIFDSKEESFSVIAIESDSVILDLNFKSISISNKGLFSVIQLNNSANVIIKHGTLGLSSKYGIYGISNRNITISDIIIKDFETFGIIFNDIVDCQIKNCLINSGSSNNIVGGILINNFKPDCQIKNSRITIENVKIFGLKAAIEQAINVIGISGENKFFILKDPDGFDFKWQDFYQNGVFAPNDNTKAQTYATFKSAPSRLPSGFAENILSNIPSEEIFLSHVYPKFSFDNKKQITTGVFGIRLDSCNGAIIKNCSISDMKSLGDKGKLLADIPAGQKYTQYKQMSYVGNDVFGLSLFGCKNCTIKNISVDNLETENGSIYAVGLFNNAQANMLKNIVCSDHHAKLDNVTCLVNPSSKVINFFVSESHSNTFIDCIAKNSFCPREIYGFVVETSKFNSFKNSQVFELYAYSGKNLQFKKSAIGFLSLNSIVTTFDMCKAFSVSCVNESDASSSCCAGFALLENDKDAHIKNCESSHNINKFGLSFGILLSGAKTSNIIANTLSHQAYGLADTCPLSTSLILKNLAYSNDISDYAVEYVHENKNNHLPVINIRYPDLSNLAGISEWFNISANS